MKYAWAVPGAKVVCTRGGTPTCDGAQALGAYPVLGLVYTIAFVRIVPAGVVLVLEEIPDAGEGTGWGIYAFKPLATQSDDIAKFTHLLNTTGVEVDA